MGASTPPTSTGGRRRRTPRSVHIKDKIANSVIRLGGVAVIAAVLGICLYLAAVVAPLFQPGTSESGAAGEAGLKASPIAVLPDEYGGTAAIVQSDGSIDVLLLAEQQLLGHVDPPAETSAISVTPDGLVAWGFADGAFQLGVVRASARALSAERIESLGDTLVVEQDGPFDGYRSTAEAGTQRVTTFSIETRERTERRDDPGAVTLLDFRKAGGGRELLFTAWEDGSARLSTVRVVRPLDGSEPRLRLSGRAVELESPGAVWVAAFGSGDSLVTLAADGSARRYGLPVGAGRRDPIVIAERVDLTGSSPARAMVALPGGNSIVVGAEDGSVWVWTLSRDPLSEAPDRKRLVLVDTIRSNGSPVVALTAGQRDRTITIAYANGRLEQRHITSGKVVASLDAAASELGAVSTVGMSPRQDALVAAGEGGAYVMWRIDPSYAGAGWQALFGRVLYEGETVAKWVYQSSSAEDAAEVKLSLVPLVFGTFKATVVAMIIAAPLSVLAAIYSSEFLHRRVRSTVKPAIELMASLPSVVLGFIAMAVVAPWVGDHLAGVMLGLLAVPGLVLLAAHLWQLLPSRVLTAVPTWARITIVGATIMLGASASIWVGGPTQRALFGPSDVDLWLSAGSFEAADEADLPGWVGRRQSMSPDVERRLRADGFAFRDGAVVVAAQPERGSEAADRVSELRTAAASDDETLRKWLDGLHGRAWPGWALILIPIAAPLAWWGAGAVRKAFAPQDMPRLTAGIVELGAFGLTLLLGLAGAAGGAMALEAAGLDPRDSLLGTFSQRNTLVVGLVMGFAIIPIIYTISEDALSAVPDTLRSASLGAGATPWQTAWRVVLPVATSGVFSACMIGLGRAAGETMIMLMATGNTPQMDFNLFSGFRTLAANIATELPEAERGGTHYRVLFLCGLVLFIVTFVINTLAEVVRQRFRKKSASL